MTGLTIEKYSPTGNMTILVFSPVARARQGEIARCLMNPDGVAAEQVGFVEAPQDPAARARLQMMGGEFCGNATMALAAHLAIADGGRGGVFPLEVSGAAGLICCRVEPEKRGFRGTVSMPLPATLTETGFPGVGKLPVIHLPGIAHAIVEERAFPAEARIRAMAACVSEEAFGLLLLDGDAMRPLVYVKPTDSAVWENGCGSGSSAVGAYRALKNGASVHAVVRNPGGEIQVTASYGDGMITGLEICGHVRCVLAGEAFVE